MRVQPFCLAYGCAAKNTDTQTPYALQCFTVGQTLIQWGISTTSNARLFGLYESTSQTTSRSVQPFCRAHDRDQQTCHTVQRRTDHGMSVHARRNSTAHWRCGLMVFMAFSSSYSDCMSSRGSFDGRRLSAG